MRLKTYWISVEIAKWFAVFIIPIPVVLLLWYGVVLGLIGPDRWGAFSYWLSKGYDKVGLTGVLYLFSWPRTTVFLVQVGLPYGLLALFIKSKIINTESFQRRPESTTSRSVFKAIVAFVSFPVTLILLRIILPPTLLALSDVLFTAPQSTIIGVLILLLVYGFPYAAVCILVEFLLQAMARIRESAKVPSCPSQK